MVTSWEGRRTWWEEALLLRPRLLVGVHLSGSCSVRSAAPREKRACIPPAPQAAPRGAAGCPEGGVAGLAHRLCSFLSGGHAVCPLRVICPT